MAMVKLSEEEIVEKRAELGRVLKDIATAEAEVTTANERVKLAKEHVNVLNEKHRDISRIVSSGEEERDGQIPLPLSKEEKKAAKKERQAELPNKAPVSAVAGVRFSITPADWVKLSEDDVRKIKHHAAACGATVYETDEHIRIEVVPSTDAGKALADVLRADLKIAFAVDAVNAPTTAPEAKPSTVPAARVLILGTCWEVLTTDQRDSFLLAAGGYGAVFSQHDGGAQLSQAIAKSDGLLKQLLSLVESMKLAFEVIDCTLSAPITGELPPPSTPSTPEEIVARSKWLHVVLNKLPDGPWTIVCESDEKKDAIAEFNAQHKLMKRAGGEVRRYEHKTEKRRFPMPKDEAEPAETQAAV